MSYTSDTYGPQKTGSVPNVYGTADDVQNAAADIADGTVVFAGDTGTAYIVQKGVARPISGARPVAPPAAVAPNTKIVSPPVQSGLAGASIDTIQSMQISKDVS